MWLTHADNGSIWSHVVNQLDSDTETVFDDDLAPVAARGDPLRVFRAGDINDFGLIIPSVTPAVSGDTVTPGASNTFGSFAALYTSAEVTDKAYGILINFNNNAVSATARDTLVDIGVDEAGGTNYRVVIPTLLASSAGTQSASNGGCGGIWYYFPLGIEAGSSVAARASVNNATAGSFQVACWLHCRPRRPDLHRVGSFVRAFGINTATSSGTAITPNGSGSKSAFVQLGSATVEPLWWWNIGVGINNAVSSNSNSLWDLSSGSSTTLNRPIIMDQLVMPGAVETLAYMQRGAAAQVAVGDLLFARAGSNNTSPTGMSVAAYGLGG